MSASRNMKSSTSSAYVPRIPCCKVCKDSGEPESVYTSHYVKDRDGRVCCPKLLKIQCLRCGKNGHTGGYCTAPEASIKPIQQKPVVPEPKKAAENRTSRFACLGDSSDSEDDEKLLTRKHAKPVVESRPAPATSYKPTMNNRWNNSKPAPAPVPEPASKINIENTMEFPSLGGRKSVAVNPSSKIPYVDMVAKPVPQKPERRGIVIPEVKVQVKARYAGMGIDFDWANPPAHEDDSSDDEDGDYSDLVMEIEDF